MLEPITVDSIVNFILVHRKNKVFKGLDRQGVKNLIRHCITNNSIAIDTTPDNKIIGVACGKRADDYKVFHIGHILCVEKGSMRRLALKFIELYPCWDIQAFRAKKDGGRGWLIRYKDANRMLLKIVNNF